MLYWINQWKMIESGFFFIQVHLQKPSLGKQLTFFYLVLNMSIWSVLVGNPSPPCLCVNFKFHSREGLLFSPPVEFSVQVFRFSLNKFSAGYMQTIQTTTCSVDLIPNEHTEMDLDGRTNHSNLAQTWLTKRWKKILFICCSVKRWKNNPCEIFYWNKSRRFFYISLRPRLRSGHMIIISMLKDDFRLLSMIPKVANHFPIVKTFKQWLLFEYLRMKGLNEIILFEIMKLIKGGVLISVSI